VVRPIKPLAGYPGEPGDEVEGPALQESRFDDKILYIPIRVEYYDWLRELEREAYKKQTGRTLPETEPKTGEKQLTPSALTRIPWKVAPQTTL